jgi:MoaA/NifB/PqqE/SkfB family radical SAM enzyme
LRKNNYDFADIWQNSDLFAEMRNVNGYHGRCGYCEYRKVCGGCRARAFAETGDYLSEEPYCIYKPHAKPTKNVGSGRDLETREGGNDYEGED